MACCKKPTMKRSEAEKRTQEFVENVISHLRVELDIPDSPTPESIECLKKLDTCLAEFRMERLKRLYVIVDD
ncbi:MAG: hypothetical protein Q7R73_03900 [bacterium]|nr:hypothetical protein [bacterium]